MRNVKNMATSSVFNMRPLCFRKKYVFEAVRRINIETHSSRGLGTIVKHQTSVDENIKEQLKNDNMKHNRHEGIQHVHAISLPPILLKSLKNYLKDQPMNHLQPHAEAMARYLWSRKRPVEETDMRKRAREYAKEMGIADVDEDSAEIPNESWKKMASVMRKLRQNLYNWKPIH